MSLRIKWFQCCFSCRKNHAKKLGQFVTLWKRATPSSPIIPLDISDGIDFIIICVKDGENHGQFIFSSKVLVKQNIMSHHGQGGKLAFRIYPVWVKPQAKAALKTQQWQLQHFFSTSQKTITGLQQIFNNESSYKSNTE